MQMYHNANIFDVDSITTHSDGTKGHQQRKAKGWGKDADIDYKSMPVIGS